MEAATTSDRIRGLLWVSFLPRDRENTLEALKHAGEAGIVGLKTTFLLGGNPNPAEWDEETKELADLCFDTAEKHDYVFHFHTSAGGNSDINNFIPMVEAYGMRCKIHLVHFGGGVSGHIKLVPKFLQWVKDGYKVYTDTSWAVGFGARWLLVEIEKQGIGGDRVIFGSDEPWSDFMGEYWKIEGAPVSEELKRMVFVDNFVKLHEKHW
jgi:predicted TIM-barrel fold metal-dependent hydrolase